MFKLEYHGEFASVRVAVNPGVLRVGPPGLPPRDYAAVPEGPAAHLTYVGMKHGAIGGNPQVRFLGNLVNHIQAESPHAFIHPPVNHAAYFIAYHGIVPVQIGLFHGKLVKIVLSQFRHPLP